MEIIYKFIEDDFGIVYKVHNKINGKIYIGVTTKGLSRRISEHVMENSSPVQKALNKYGLQSFDISVIDYAEDKEALFDKEVYWIQFYDCKAPNGYNLTAGGEGLIDPVKEVIDRISKTVSESLVGNQRALGFRHSASSIKSISEGIKKRWQDPEGRAEKIRQSRTGKKFPMTENIIIH